MDNIPCIKLDKVTCRRKSDPRIVLRIWSAINSAGKDGQPTDAVSLLQYLNNDAERSDLCEISIGFFNTQLQFATDDCLLVCTQDYSYSIPHSKDARQDGHDWYCFKCHQEGNVVMCNSCWRVYHPMCILKQLKGGSLFVCLMCKSSRYKKKTVSSELLAFVLVRLKNKTGPLYNLRSGSDPVQEAFPLLFYETMDLNTVQSRVINNNYSTMEQFERDIWTICHNISVAYGESSDLAQLAGVLLKDCRFELDELRQCVDCYYLSNLKPRNWFCYPCRPPHNLVYAKLRGFSYWPAKIITATLSGYNVRFFGGLHQRAVIAEAYIRSIDTEPSSLIPRKPNKSLTRALDELKLYQKMLQQKSTCTVDIQAWKILNGMSARKRKLSTTSLEHSNDGTISARKRKLSTTSLEHSFADSQTSVISDCWQSNDASDAVSIQSASLKQVIESVQKHSRLLNESNSSQERVQSDEAIQELSLNRGINCETMQLRVLTEYTNCLKVDNPTKTTELIDELKTRKNDVFLQTILSLHHTVEKIRKDAESRASDFSNKKLKAMEQHFERQITDSKKRQWCYNCLNPAQYYCCWNTSYCSLHCQREHWQNEHRNVCRRVHRNQPASRDNGQLSFTPPCPVHLSRPVNDS